MKREDEPNAPAHLRAPKGVAKYRASFDMSSFVEMRTKFEDQILKADTIKLGFMSTFARASILALKEIPATKAGTEGGDSIAYGDYVGLSVAVATPKGLVTPVLGNKETMAFLEDIYRGNRGTR